MTDEETKILTPKDYILLIDAQYLKAKAAGLSRIDTRWGKWSRQMNVELRERIDAHDPEEPKLKAIVVYWTLRSQLLELYHKRTIFGESKKKRMSREIKKMRMLILEGFPEFSDEDFMGRIFAGMDIASKKGLL